MNATTALVSVLFVRPDSIYKSLAEVDCYDAQRNALTWPGGSPVVAHPPCRTWSQLRAFAKAPAEEHDLALWAIEQVRRWGGVLEHPATSKLWEAAQLPRPGGLPDEWGGWTWECDQYHWGHLARKRTRLYIVGTMVLPSIPYRVGEPTHCVSSLSGQRRSREERHRLPTWKPELGPNRRDKTPVAFASWLIALARAAGLPNGRTYDC